MATVNGTSFADNLVGTSGADTMNGRAGNDVIRGGGGRDTITLGSGRDTAVYTATTDSPFGANGDVITDFAKGDDRIDLTALLGATDLTWGGLTATANGVWYSRSGTTVSILVDTNGLPGTPEMRIDLLNISTTTVLAASDFTGVVVRTNAAPIFTSQANWTMPENGTAIGTVAATDADSPALTYSVVAGVDASRVSINPTTGVLSFVIAPNFEVPADVGANNVYNFTVQASDGALNTTQAVTVTVSNVNEAAPVFASPATFSVPENGTAVGTVAATDSDNQALTYSLVAGGDASAFTINAATGALAFASAPNFEVPTDAGANNVYNLTVQASDGTLNTTQAVAVTVTDVNETPTGAAPVFTSPAAFSIAENSTAVGAVVATDADSPTVTYSLVAGGDAGAFTVNAATGALSFAAAPNFEAPTDAGANNVYNLTVQASDGTLNTTQAVAVTVTDVLNETLTGNAADNTLAGAAGNDTFTGNGGADTLTGNGGGDTFVFASAQDSPANTNWQTPPDGSVTRVWDVITDFTLGSDKIDLSALLGATDLAWAGTTPTGNAVWYVNSGTQAFIYADIDNNPPPDVMIALQNAGSMALTASDFIGVVGGFTGGIGAAPVFTSPATFSAPENGAAVGTVAATDADSPTLAYSLVAGGDASAFTINATTGALAFAAAPNFEVPTDAGANNVYNVTVQASDGVLNTTQAIAVTVTNVNDVAPAFTSPATFMLPENSTAVGIVAATDADNPTVTYSLVAGGDAVAFTINTTTGALAFASAPNFEAPTDVGANNIYNLTVQATDGTLNTTQAVAVTVTDVNETPTGAAPVFTSPAAFSIAENSTAVGAVVATDADSPTVTYSLVAGGDAGAFTINAATGALSFAAAPNFETPTDAGANNVYNLTVQASDGTLNTTQAVAVTVTDVLNETLTGNAADNTLAGAAGNDTFTGNGGADTLTGNGGGDTFVVASAQDSPANTNWQTPPDGSVTRVWDVITDFTLGSDKIDLSALLGATDLAWAGSTPTGNAVWYVNSGTQAFIYADIDNNPPPDVMIALQNAGSLALTASDFIGVVGGFTGGIGAAPVFTSPATFSVPENGTAAGTVAATDADSPTLTYSLAGGADAARFGINSATGALSFVAAPNFEAPADVGANNVYNVTVQASDGTLNTTQAIAVTVTNVNDVAPAFTSPATFTLPENGTAVGTVAATDADSPSVTYSLVAGGDAAAFTINAATGALAFAAAPNFEAPTDAGANNVYNLTVQTSDGTLNTTQAVAVTVTDVVTEAIAGTAGNDTLAGTVGDDLIDIGAGGNDTVAAGSGTDTILAGAAFNAADRIDGGTEVDDTIEPDVLVLDGNYAAGVSFAAATLVNVEEILLTAGNSYSLTTSDGTVVASSISIDGSALLAGNTLTVNAAAETEAGASYTMTGGAGNDILTGGAGPDYFDISFGGNDAVSGGAGRDTIYAGSALTAADQVNGGAGVDLLYLNGDYGAGLALGAATLTGIEGIAVQAGSNYSLTMNNAMLTGIQTASVDGFALGSGNTLAVNAAAETDSGVVYTLSGGAGNDSLTGGAGNDLLNGNAGNDILVGGAGNDILTGGAGNDALTGGLGNDVFDFNAIADRGTAGDTIADFSRSGANGTDVLNLHDLLLTFTGFNGSNAFSGGYLQFDMSSGTSTTVRVDSNGGANGYVALATLTGTLLQQADTANYVL